MTVQPENLEQRHLRSPVICPGGNNCLPKSPRRPLCPHYHFLLVEGSSFINNKIKYKKRGSHPSSMY